MPDRLHIAVDGETLSVEVHGDDIVVSSDAGGTYRVVSGGNGRFRVTTPDGDVDALAAAIGDHVWVSSGGETFDCRIQSASVAERAARASGVWSPMPATVTALPVRVGQSVNEGDLLVALEAMKMELPLRAPRAGVIAAIHCRVGELVQPDVTLIELGPST